MSMAKAKQKDKQIAELREMVNNLELHIIALDCRVDAVNRTLRSDIAFLNKKLDEIECSVAALRAEQEHARRGLWRRFCARVRLFLGCRLPYEV